MQKVSRMSALDPDVANQLAEDLPPDVFRTIISTFEDDLTRLAQELAAAAQTGDQEGYERAAHSLAGAAAGRFAGPSPLGQDPAAACDLGARRRG